MYDYCFVYFDYDSYLFPGTYAIRIFGSTPTCFLTIFMPVDFVHRISDCLAIEPLHIKYNVFCILPGLHLVPFPNVTSSPHGIVRLICVCEGDSETWSLILITLLTLCFLAACYGYQK